VFLVSKYFYIYNWTGACLSSLFSVYVVYLNFWWE